VVNESQKKVIGPGDDENERLYEAPGVGILKH
jgi:hypothetical protein